MDLKSLSEIQALHNYLGISPDEPLCDSYLRCGSGERQATRTSPEPPQHTQRRVIAVAKFNLCTREIIVSPITEEAREYEW